MKLTTAKNCLVIEKMEFALALSLDCCIIIRIEIALTHFVEGKKIAVDVQCSLKTFNHAVFSILGFGGLTPISSQKLHRRYYSA